MRDALHTVDANRQSSGSRISIGETLASSCSAAILHIAPKGHRLAVDGCLAGAFIRPDIFRWRNRGDDGSDHDTSQSKDGIGGYGADGDKEAVSRFRFLAHRLRASNDDAMGDYLEFRVRRGHPSLPKPRPVIEGLRLMRTAPLSFRHAFVTGGAGFIGSAVVDRLLAMGCRVTAFDNLSSGFREFLISAMRNPAFTFIEGDLLNEAALEPAMAGTDFVFHLAANADVRFGTNHPRRDLEQNTIATSNVLEAMRSTGVHRIAFASTGSVYGDTTRIPTAEDAPFPIQTSLYGASKLAGEGLIAAYCEGFAFQGFIFRFVSILGERYTHGHIFDFYRKLKSDPAVLPVLGDGTQRKSYLYIQDCLDGILTGITHAIDKVNIINLGTEEYISVNQSISTITAHMNVAPSLSYSGGSRGWIGDNPFIFLDTTKIRSLGWAPTLSIRAAVTRTAAWLEANEWVFGRRS